MTSVRGTFGNAALSRPAADAWCLFEIDGGNPPILLDSHGVGSVSRVQTGVYRVSFTNPERFASGAYVGLVQDELGNASSGYGVAMVHGTTGNSGVTASGASASCDIVSIGFTPQDISIPTVAVDSSNTVKVKINAAFFCLRSDSDTNKTSVANLLKWSEDFNLWTNNGASVVGSISKSSTVLAPFSGASATNYNSNASNPSENYVAQIATKDGIHRKTYTFSVYARAGSGLTATVMCGGVNNNFGFNYNLSTSAVTLYSNSTPFNNGATCSGRMVDVGDGWKRCVLTYIPTTTGQSVPLITNTEGTANKNFYIWGSQLEEGTVVTPYIKTTATAPVYGNQDLLIDTHPGTNGFGVGSRQNLFKHSETFTNAYWTKLRVGISAGGYTAPNGTTTAMKLHELDPTNPSSTPTGSGFYYKSIQTTATPIGSTCGNGNYTVSIFAKAAERQYLTVTDTTYGSFGQLVVDLTDGNITQNTLNLSAKTIPYGNGWWRVVVSYRTPTTLTTGTHSFGFAPNPGSTVNSQYGPSSAGVSGSGILIWGAQLEQGTVFGEYTPTGAAVAGTTYARLAGNTYPSAVTGIGNRGEATAWGTIVIPSNPGGSTPVSAYLENSYGVASVAARSNSVFDVPFTESLSSNAYCVITGTEQESVHLPESGVGLDGSIPPTDEYTMNILRNESTAESQKTRDGFTITCLRQVPPSNYISVDTTVGTTFAGDATYKILKEHTTTSTSSSIYLKWDSLITTGSYWYRLKVQRNRAGVTTDLQDAYYTSFYDYRVGHTQNVHSYHTMKYDVSGNQNGDKYIISGVASTTDGTAVAGGSSQTLQLTNFVAFNRNCNFTPRAVHYQRGRTQRIHFIVFGGEQTNGTP